jgi:mitogen-activated protein kinase kinase 4
MADQPNQVRRSMLKMDFPVPNSNNSIGGFRPLPSQPGATIDKLGAAAGSNRPKMSLPAVPKSAIDPTIDRTRDSRFKICQSMNSSGKLQIDGKTYDFTSDDLQDIGEIGRGGFGTVNKMVHRKSNTVVAVKRIRSTVDEKEQKQLLMDLDVVMKSNECRYIVQFYGALFKEVSFKSAKSSSWFRVTTNMCLTSF